MGALGNITEEIRKDLLAREIAKRLLSTCHYLEHMNAYLLGKIQLPELKSLIASTHISSKSDVSNDSAELTKMAEDIFERELTEMELSYVLGLTLEEVSNIKKSGG